MNSISKVDTQSVVNRIVDISVSERVHKVPLTQAVKDVRSAVRQLAYFQPEQAKRIVCGMQKAVVVLAAQKSNMEEKKAGNLRELASHLRACFSHSMDRMSHSIAVNRQKQAEIPVMAEREEVRIDNKYQCKIDGLRKYLGEIREFMRKHDQLLGQRNGLDATFVAMLMKNGFSESEKWIALTHYEAPTIKKVNGFDHHSSDDVFSDKEAQRRFGGIINSQVKYGGGQYAEILINIYTPANAKAKAWVQFRELAEHRRLISNELCQHPIHANAEQARAICLAIKAEKIAWTSELKTLQILIDEQSGHLQRELDKAYENASALRDAHDALLADQKSRWF